MSHAPRPTGQTGTKPDKVRLCPRSNSGQTRTHPYRGVRCPEDDVVKEGRGSALGNARRAKQVVDPKYMPGSHSMAQHEAFAAQDELRYTRFAPQ